MSAGYEVTPEVEDARRRFLLTLRVMISRKEKEERTKAAIREWTQALENEIRAYRKWRKDRLHRRIKRAAFVACLFLLVFHDRWNSPLMWVLMFVGGAAADAAAPNRRQVVTALARTRDPAAISALAMACLKGDKETREVAARGLKSILPALQASDKEHVTGEGMEALLGLLKSPRDLDLTIAILKALEQVGDARALPVVESLAKLPAMPQTVYTGQLWVDKAVAYALRSAGVRRQNDFERLSVAIYDCLQYLRARTEHERLRSTLLRAVANPAEPAQTLLRPAGGVSSTPAEQLLRPTVE